MHEHLITFPIAINGKQMKKSIPLDDGIDFFNV